MSITIPLPLRAFTVPNFVLAEVPAGLKQDGVREAPSFPVRDLPAETLSALCDEFRAGVFAKAGKKDPSTLDPAGAQP